jgi:hypothetical protein
VANAPVCGILPNLGPLKNGTQVPSKQQQSTNRPAPQAKRALSAQAAAEPDDDEHINMRTMLIQQGAEIAKLANFLAGMKTKKLTTYRTINIKANSLVRCTNTLQSHN